MTDPILLTAAAVAGGAIVQSISIFASQRNTSSVTQSATATNSGRVTATAIGAVATAATAGSEATNTALVLQVNVIAALNNFRFSRY
jgi:hypothetical protein